jgi:hypothetical protein
MTYPAPQVNSPTVDDHAGADGGVGGLVDEDEPAGEPVAVVGVEVDGLGGAQADAADVIRAQLGGVLGAVEAVDVEAVSDVGDHRVGVGVVCLTAYNLPALQRPVGRPRHQDV